MKTWCNCAVVSPMMQNILFHIQDCLISLSLDQNVAHHVVSQAAKQLTPCVVELGGKDALIVLDDVKDVQSLSSVILRGTFQSAGQNCIGVERVICLPKVYEQLVEIFTRESSHLELDRILTNWMK